MTAQIADDDAAEGPGPDLAEPLPGAVFFGDEDGSFVRGRRIAEEETCAYFEASLGDRAVCAKIPAQLLEPEAHGVTDRETLAGCFAEGGLWFELADEVRQYAEVNHPHLAKYEGMVYQTLFGSQVPTHVLFEFCEEGTLRAAKDRAGGKLPLLEMERYMGEACRGLEFLHSRRLAHRNVQPDSLHLHRGSVKLADVGGLFTVRRAGIRSSTATPYTAPEVRLGGWPDAGSPLAHSADIYSLAVSTLDLCGAVVGGTARHLVVEGAQLARRAPNLGGLTAAISLEAAGRPSAGALAGVLFGHAAERLPRFVQGMELILRIEIVTPGVWFGSQTWAPGMVVVVEEVLPDGSAYMKARGRRESCFYVAHEFAAAFAALPSAGGIKLLTELLATCASDARPGALVAEDCEVYEMDVEALGRLAYASDETCKAIVEVGGIASLQSLLKVSTGTLQAATMGLLRTVAVDSEICTCIVNSGCISLVVKLLRVGSSEVQAEAAGLLWNLAYTSARNQDAIAELGGIKALVMLLSSLSEDVQKNAAGAVRNMTYRNARNTKAVVQADGICSVVNLLFSDAIDVQVQAAGALMSLTDGSAENAIAAVAADSIHPLVTMLSASSPEAQLLAAGALGNLAATAEHRIAIKEAGGIEPLVCLSKSLGSPPDVKDAAGEALRNLAYRDAQIQAAISAARGVSPSGAPSTATSTPRSEAAARTPSVPRKVRINEAPLVALPRAASAPSVPSVGGVSGPLSGLVAGLWASRRWSSSVEISQEGDRVDALLVS